MHGMTIAIRYAIMWTIAMAALMLPLAIVARVLLDAGASRLIAFLCGAAASMAAFLGMGMLAVFIAEKTGVGMIPSNRDDPGLYGVLIALVLCTAGSYAIARVASSIF